MFYYDALNIRRRELLHRKWTDRVYDPIRRQVLSEISGKDFENLLLHKRLLYNEFLAKRNRKVLTTAVLGKQDFLYLYLLCPTSFCILSELTTAQHY